MGLKDQQLALKWIHSNIGHFSGDNTRITLFGHSAGGSSTHFHMLSSESRKYFRNAIPMSGTIDDTWAMSDERDHFALMQRIVKDFDESKETPEELIEVLKTVPFEKFVVYGALDFTPRTLKPELGPIIESKNSAMICLVCHNFNFM